jgi:hypothetical protein
MKEASKQRGYSKGAGLIWMGDFDLRRGPGLITLEMLAKFLDLVTNYE